MALFIGRLAHVHDKAKLEEMFRSKGPLKRWDPRHAMVFVTYENEKDAEAALAEYQDYEIIPGHKLSIEWTKESGRTGENRPRVGTGVNEQSGKPPVCYKCGEPGHVSRGCPRNQSADGDRRRSRSRERYRSRSPPPRDYRRERDHRDRDRDRDYYRPRSRSRDRDRDRDYYRSRRDSRDRDRDYYRRSPPRERYYRSRSRSPGYRRDRRSSRDRSPHHERRGGERDRERSREREFQRPTSPTRESKEAPPSPAR